MAMIAGLCLALVATQAAPVFVPVRHFTLAWTHSIEKTRWEEDYAVLPVSPPRLLARAARIKGSGAGMEPPDGARLSRGWYEYRPAERLPTELLLSRSRFVPDYELCTSEGCRPLEHWLPSDGQATRLFPCLAPRTPSLTPGGGAGRAAA